MIIIGYQGIGKTSLAKKDIRYIDFESSVFWIDGERWSNWYKVYVRQAVRLSKAGYCMFVSSHKEVRDEIIDGKHWMFEDVVEVFPSIELKDYWLGKLRERYEATEKEKDKKAWLNAVKCYEESIRDLERDKYLGKIVLDKEDYILEEELRRYISKAAAC